MFEADSHLESLSLLLDHEKRKEYSSKDKRSAGTILNLSVILEGPRKRLSLW